VVGAVARRTVPMAVQTLVTREETVECGEHVRIRARADLDDDDTGRRVRDEDREEPVAVVGRLTDKGLALASEVVQSPAGAGPDCELPGLYGKMLRNASRRRPRPPIAGAESNRDGSPAPRLVAPHSRRPTAVL
jgi:hypothetical protein